MTDPQEYKLENNEENREYLASAYIFMTMTEKSIREYVLRDLQEKMEKDDEVFEMIEDVVDGIARSL